MKKVKFGFCVPTFANPGIAFFRTPAFEKLDWDSIREAVLLIEELGYDSIFVADHLFLGRDGDIWECTALMSAFAALTRNIEIIPIHLCNNFRTPSVVAKTLATISHIADGRVSLFYDYGWRKAEFDAYGIDFGQDGERVKQMAEGLTIIKGMLEEEQFSFTGDYYSVKKAVCNPKPVRKIPVWMGEANNPEMVSEIVRHADVFNSMPCSPQGFQEKIEVLKQECERQGRDFSEIGLSLETQVLIRENDREIDHVFELFQELKRYNNSYDEDILIQMKATNPALENYSSKKDFENEFMIGPPKIIREKLDQFIERGVTHFMLWFMDFPDQTGIKLFAEKVFPHYE